MRYRKLQASLPITARPNRSVVVHAIGGFDKVQPAESAGLVNLLKRLSGLFDMLLPRAPAAYPRIYDERS
jgi:hypothetical protein